MAFLTQHCFCFTEVFSLVWLSFYLSSKYEAVEITYPFLHVALVQKKLALLNNCFKINILLWKKTT
jgi:hypothetical protein